MGHFAQYRKRGGGSTGFLLPPPVITTQYTVAKNTTHVQVTMVANPPGATPQMLFQDYLVSTPNTLVETNILVPNLSNTIGPASYSVSNVVGVRAAWTLNGVTPASPWSSESQLTF